MQVPLVISNGSRASGFFPPSRSVALGLAPGEVRSDYRPASGISS